jgi:hypothetical protein
VIAAAIAVSRLAQLIFVLAAIAQALAKRLTSLSTLLAIAPAVAFAPLSVLASAS